MVAVASISYAELSLVAHFTRKNKRRIQIWKKTKSSVHKERLRFMTATQHYDFPPFREAPHPNASRRSRFLLYDRGATSEKSGEKFSIPLGFIHVHYYIFRSGNDKARPLYIVPSAAL